MIYILSGPIRSGKTTALQKWLAENQIRAGGFLTPDQDGKRIIYDIELNSGYPLEVHESLSRNIIKVGHFTFDNDIFLQFSDMTIRQCMDGKEWIILDEIGKLEITEQGFHKLTEGLLLLKKPHQKYLFVIRDTLVDQVVKKYNIQNATILKASKLNTLIGI
ncbi:MAG: hypothetical protein IPM42_08880 [Saprospiraceae bacterium]|nr:hypothetical protein [Saprospiraceae bacterium]